MTQNLSDLFGRPTHRIDGVAKVTGAARFASDEPATNPAFAYLVTSSIARGRVSGFRLENARAVDGLLDILTHENVGDQVKSAPGPDGKASTTVLESDRVWYAGQIVAVVIANTFEAAREAACKVDVVYVQEPSTATFDAPGVQVERHRPPRGPEPDPNKGDARGSFERAAIKIDSKYSTPTQHHNPIELFTTTCMWEGAKLTIFEPSQYMWGTKGAIAKQLGLDPDNVRVISRYIGGAFGSKDPNPRTAWIALASKRLGRPVKLVPTRAQGFTIATYRA